MLTLYQCKPAFQNWLRPLVNQLANWHITPNHVTVSAILLSGASGLALVQSLSSISVYLPKSQLVFACLPVVLLGRMALNAIDGMLAREHNQISPLGAILNEVGDVVSDAALYLPFSLIPGISAPWIVGIVLLACITEMVGVLGLAIANKRCYAGPMGKSDRALVFGLIGLGFGLGVQPADWLTGIWIGVFFLQLWTIINRVHSTLLEAAPCK
jgi:CDP-diacylglycerol---glycerol-3-phosphate 3-phosphatidyltransferase